MHCGDLLIGKTAISLRLKICIFDSFVYSGAAAGYWLGTGPFHLVALISLVWWNCS